MGNWKSVKNPYRGKMELYDLDADIGEQSDVADQNQDIVLAHEEILDKEHTDLPLVESVKVLLRREGNSPKKIVLFGAMMVCILLVIGYVVYFKMRDRA
jgi:hypothetical protein